MKFSPGDEVVVVADPLNYGLPLDSHAVLLKVDLNPMDIRRYYIRIPLKREEYWVTETSIELASEVNAKQADKALREHSINVSLDDIKIDYYN